MKNVKWNEIPDSNQNPDQHPMARWFELRRQHINQLTGFKLFSFNSDSLRLLNSGIRNKFQIFGDIYKDIPTLPNEANCSDKADRPDIRSEARPYDGLDEHSVVMGIIDDGIPVAHPALRHEHGKTRALALWQQDANCSGSENSSVPYGRVFCSDQFSSDRDDYTSNTVYRNAGLTGPGALRFNYRSTHGAAIVDQFCAKHPDRPDAVTRNPERFPIFAVNLPVSLVEDTAGAFLHLAVVDAISFIVSRTDQLIDNMRNQGSLPHGGPGLPLVINFSFGLSTGGRDGSHLIAQYLDRLKVDWLRKHRRPFHAVFPVGNGFQRRGVQVATLRNGKTHKATLRVEPGARASSIVEIENLSNVQGGSKFQIAVKVTPPFCTTTNESNTKLAYEHGDAIALTDEAETEVYAAIFYFHRPICIDTDDLRETITLAIQPSQTVNGTEPTLPPGDWEIEVQLTPEGNTGTPIEIELRVLRNDLPSPTLSRGQKARFVDEDFPMFDENGNPSDEFQPHKAKITRSRTINTLSTGKYSIAVGATQGGSGPKMSPYSAAGPSISKKNNNHNGVTCVTQVDDNLLLRGKRLAGVAPGSTQRRSGTSIAAPIVARWLASEMSEAMAKGKNPVFLRPKDFPTTKVPNTSELRQGFGKIITCNKSVS